MEKAHLTGLFPVDGPSGGVLSYWRKEKHHNTTTGKGSYMKYAVKNKGKIVKAYCLGAGSEMERFLMDRGRIRRLPDGGYALMSREAKNGAGQRAAAGDYFKVDHDGGEFFPYPNDRVFFLQNHIHIGQDTYEQKTRPLAVWQWGDAPCDAMDYLLRTKQLTLNEADEGRFWNAFLWGAELSAARDAAVVFYDIFRDDTGAITDVRFNFVEKDVFERSYTICAEP